MIPAHEVDWLDGALTPEAALDEVVEHAHTRYPVGEGSLNDLAGVVHVRDLVAASRSDTGSLVRDLARPVPIVPESKDLGALLRELRAQRQQLAVVVDEYGLTTGIVTLEDILEELVGEIEDEYDLPDATLQWLDERTLQVAGSMSVDDFNETVGTTLPQTEHARTLAGLVFHALGRRPDPGDSVEVEGARFTVEELDGSRIARLRVRLPAPAGHQPSA
jgi:putative hemolysin